MIPQGIENPGRTNITACYITSYKMKMWGSYPTLVPRVENDTAEPFPGFAYKVQTRAHVNQLTYYETENYVAKAIDITLLVYMGEEASIIRGQAFIWNGYPEELKGGKFDIKDYQIAGY